MGSLYCYSYFCVYLKFFTIKRLCKFLKAIPSPHLYNHHTGPSHHHQAAASWLAYLLPSLFSTLLLLTRHLEWSFSNVHHITSLSCSRPSHSSHLTPRKGKLLTTSYCPSNLISYLSPLSPSLPPSRHNGRLALPQTCLPTIYLRAFAHAEPSTWKTLVLTLPNSPSPHSGLKLHILREALSASHLVPLPCFIFLQSTYYYLK